MSLLSQYRKHIEVGDIRPDDGQEGAIIALDALYARLLNPRPVLDKKPWWSFAKAQQHRAGGLYIWGDVGRGKSMVMDLFHEVLPEKISLRIHFHRFMVEVHQHLHERRQSGDDMTDPLPHVAREMLGGIRVLCFDEFLVDDVADAMILQRLIECIIDDGIAIVLTSNFAPDHLYAHGLQRERFIPCIAMLKESLDVLSLNGDVDYRQGTTMADQDHWITPRTTQSRLQLKALFADYVGDASIAPLVMKVAGHILALPQSAGRAAYCSFDDLCGKALGANDYLALSEKIDLLCMDGVPIFDESTQDQAKRFMTLVDALYDAKCRLAVTADTEPNALCKIASLDFQFQRTASRLQEMRGWG